jgi:CheY-like chemotaxis protein
MTITPKVFISYSHDNSEHTEWVYSIACRLVESGVDIVLDQWDLQLGSNLMQFMENGLTDSDRVLVICTDNYNRKSNEGIGGVGYEKIILTAGLFAAQDSRKFIPCIRGVSTKSKTPIFLSGQNYIDFSDNDKFEERFKLLLHELFGVPLRPKPPLGENPFIASAKQNVPNILAKTTETRILVIDDESNIRLLYSYELTEEGYDVSTAATALEAVEKLESEDFNLVILDIKLGDESGLDLLQKFVKEHHELPVILCSAYSCYKDDFSAWLADGYVVKSSDLKDLKDEIKRVLNRKAKKADQIAVPDQ